MKKIVQKKGFTMVELLIVIFLVAILAVTASSSYFNSTKNFQFLEGSKKIMSAIKAGRSYAITNQETNGKVPERYGIKIESQKTTLFADDGTTDFAFDLGAGDPAQGADSLIETKVYDFNGTPYQIEAFDSGNNALTMPIILFYESGSSDLTTKYDIDGANSTLSKSVDKFLYLKYLETGTDRVRYIVVFQISGLPEEYEDINSL